MVKSKLNKNIGGLRQVVTSCFKFQTLEARQDGLLTRGDRKRDNSRWGQGERISRGGRFHGEKA